MNKKILIIDDNEQDRKAMSIALGKSGYLDIDFAATAAEGLEKAGRLKPQVVILDVLIPPVNGLDLVRKVKDLSGAQTKVIVMTGHLEAVDANKARSSGADEILVKDQGFGLLGKTIAELA